MPLFRITRGRKYPSTTSNLLFGNLQHRLMKAAGYQFMFFAGDGLNSSTRVRLQQGVDNRVPVLSIDAVSIGIPPSANSDFPFLLSQLEPICNSILRMRCHNRTAKRRITATSATFFFFGLRDTSSWYIRLAWG